ncbi:tyrosine-type recombinase/integrase [Campylobacter ureolyticus]|uniref:tyrosine-type recombinase/integrase n=1 Tax=Campylobacter ureolyticus TaxID=827 RepID=UPI00288B72C5|nr:tyrosine-type recombinase/integrase [Campylobacter ureolyticus]
MNIKLYNRRGMLYADYMENGERVRRSLKLQDTPANREYAKRHLFSSIEDKIKAGINTTIDLNLKAYLKKVISNTEKESTRDSYLKFLKGALKFFPCKDVTKYTVLDVDNAVEKMLNKGLNPVTIRSYFNPIRLAFDIAFRQDIITKNPIILPKMRKKDKKEVKPYNLFQVANLLNNADDELKTFLYFAFYTGARSGEILALKWGDITDDYIVISKTKNATTKKIGTPKNGKERKVIILNELKKHISTLTRGGDNESLFKNRYKAYLDRFKKLCEELGYSEQGLHSTRHTFISLCAGAKVDLTLVQKMVGHSNLNMIMSVYTHYIDDIQKRDELENAFKKIAL